MSGNDLEIEIKFCLEGKRLGDLVKTLEKRTDFLGEYRQIDRYFNPPHRDFLAPFHPYEYLRLRETEGEHVFTYKHIYFDKKGNFTHADEYETPVEEPSHLFKILEVLNFEEFITIDKKRKKFKHRDELEIVLDEVRDLGSFLEIETVRDFGGVGKAQNRIFDFARKLGVEKERRNNEGYVLAMMKKKGLR